MKRTKRPCLCRHGYLTHGLDGMCGADYCACRGYREQPVKRTPRKRKGVTP